MQEQKHAQWLEWMKRAEAENWPVLPSPPDERDWPLSRIAPPVAVPRSAGLDHLLPYVPDQLRCGNCVSKAQKNNLNVLYHDRLPHPKGFSALFMQGLCKTLDGVAHLEGTYPRVSCKVAQQYGSCPEDMMPYHQQPDCKVFPARTQAMYEAAAKYRIRGYARLQGTADGSGAPTVAEVEQALAAGKPLLAGVWVTDSFMRYAGKGNIGLPSGSIYGLHGVSVLRYDQGRGAVRGPNTWGPTWGDAGHFWLAYELFEWRNKDLGGMPAITEAWALDIEGLPEPKVDLDTLVELWIGQGTARVNGVCVPIDPTNPRVVPVITEARTMVPLRFLVETFGWDVAWNAGQQKVTIKGKGG